MQNSFNKILEEYNALTEQLSQGVTADMAKLGKRQAALLPIVENITKLQSTQKALKENEELLQNPDTQIREMATEEHATLSLQEKELQNKIEEQLLPTDERDDNNVIIEIRAGAGGDESTIFAAEIFRAYSKYAESLKFKTHILSASKSEVNGFKEVIFEVTGSKTPGPFSVFKYESGVHRVQRVPETEKSGRVHTSTITVAVMPEIEEQDFRIDPKDLKIEATTSSGHGGQSVNTTYSAIRITHIPTGITAQCQDERSQAQNKEKALAVIRARVAAHFTEIEESKIKNERRSQIGTGDRSEKIRTYNFPQDRVTDHRINENFNQINLIMEGEFGIIMNALKQADLNIKKAQLTA